MRITAIDLKSLGVVDEIIAEPVGGLHRTPEMGVAALGDALANAIASLVPHDAAKVRSLRRQKFLAMGSF
jgi:acetyl-CoA carboxylase carboxyl transferase subunit alpha